jgi:hypothetical protein
MSDIEIHSLSPADYARKQGWTAGDRILGGKIVASGQVTEKPLTVRITAVGEDQVLAKLTPGLLGKERPHEQTVEWTGGREWTKL